MVLALACGDETGQRGGSPTPSTGSTLGDCAVQISGDLEYQIVGGSTPESASSDYWLSDDQLRAALEFGGNGTDADLDAALDNGQMVTVLLQIACGDMSELGVLLSTAGGTTRSAVPFGPGNYDLVGGLFSDQPGITGALTVPGDQLFGISAGDLVIDRFDEHGVAGRFEFEAEERFVPDGSTPRVLLIEGEFDLPCPASAGRCD